MESGILGYTQTFVGVLTTLVVLCLFHNKQNFFAMFLNHLNQEAVVQLGGKVSKHIKDAVSQVEAVVNQYAKKRAAEGINNGEPNTVLLDVVARIKAKRIAPMMTELPRLQKEATTLMNETENAEEFNYVALFSFFFCITLLTIDYFSFLGGKLFLQITLHIFTIVSFIFTSFIWLPLWRRTTYKSLRQRNDDSLKDKQELSTNPKRWWHRRWIQALIGVKLFVVIPAIVLYFFNMYTPCYWWHLLVTFGLYVVACMVMMGKRFKRVTHSDNFNRHLVVNHFCYILAVSMLVSGGMLLVNILVNIYFNVDLLILKELDATYEASRVRYLSVAFAALTVFFIPFIFSYVKYIFIKWPLLYYKVASKLRQDMQKLDSAMNKLSGVGV